MSGYLSGTGVAMVVCRIYGSWPRQWLDVSGDGGRQLLLKFLTLLNYTINANGRKRVVKYFLTNVNLMSADGMALTNVKSSAVGY